MKTRLTPHYISLVYETCLKSFWRRKALANFLRQCSVSEQFLQSWTPDESKREVLDRLFLKLPKSDSGRSDLVRMAGFLMEQESFPDLENWEDSAAKLKVAHIAVSQLRRYHSNQQQEIQSEKDKVEARKRFAERQRQATQSQQTLRGLNDRLSVLAQSLGEQKAGYDFQDWFYELDQRGHLNRMLRLAPPFFVDATFCAQTLAQMRRHPELAVWVGDSCLHEPHRRSSRDRSGWPWVGSPRCTLTGSS